MIIKYLRLSKLGKFTAWCLLLAACLISVKLVSALDSTSISVNGTSIYTLAGGYNSSHGIAGVSFDVGTKTLTLTNASLDNITADDDLIVNLVGVNTITSSSPDPTIRSEAGNVTIIGEDEASLVVNASADDATAIRIGSGKRLTIGDEANPSNLITVSVSRGVNMNTEDTYVVTGNSYNPPGGGPGGPPAGDPIQISIGGTLVIDETADPQIISASGVGWTIEQGFMGIYQLEANAGATIGYITGTGDGSISINPAGGDVSITSNAGYSINMNGNVNIMTGMGAISGNISAGGIYTKGDVTINDRDMTIGSSGTPSTKGIEASSVSVGSGNLTIYTSATALQYHSAAPADGEGLTIESSAGKSLTVESSDIATANVTTATVSGGGTIDLTYTTSLGTFTSQASNWAWSDMSGTAQENPTPSTVTCSEGTNSANKYQMTTSANNFLLKSTAGTTYALSSNVPDSTDSDVTNGSVNVISGNGYKRVAGSTNYTDFVIEEGSQVTIELLPDYGYQYVSGGLNGNQTSAGADKGSYTFIMPANNLHLSAIFERSSDIIAVDSNKISGATITMPENEINGNAEFSVSDATGASTATFQSAASGSTIGGLVDLTLNEVVYKGTSDEAWKTNVTELDNDMSVNLALADSLKGHSNYSVLRDHDGTVTKLDTTYNTAAGTLSFATDAYSSYAITYSDTPGNPNTNDGIVSYLVIGLLSLAGLLISIIYLKKNKLKLK